MKEYIKKRSGLLYQEKDSNYDDKKYGELTMSVFNNKYNEDTFETTIAEERTVLLDDVKLKEKVFVSDKKVALLKPSTKELFVLSKEVTKLGRNESTCDIVIKNKTISSVHASIINKTEGTYIRDEHSSNGTRVDRELLDGLNLTPLNEYATIQLADEKLVYTEGKLTESLLRTKKCAFFHCEETDEVESLITEKFLLGRMNPWANGTFDNTRASRNHGTILNENDSYVLKASENGSTNGTYVNAHFVKPGETVPLKDGDIIGIGSVYHIHFEVSDLVIHEI